MSNSSLKNLCERYLFEEPDPELRAQISSLMQAFDEQSQNELADRMGKNCHFGTAGLRSLMEAGYNRMNLVSIFRLSHALAKELLTNKTNPSIALGFDARNNSHSFALEVAQVLGRMGIGVHIFEESVPTPICAYATKYLRADAGVMITASHNPAKDNGVKLFGPSSAQLNGPVLKSIEAAMNRAPLRPDFYEKESLCESLPISKEVVESYFLKIRDESIIKREDIDHSIDIVYSPLHGVGKKFFLKALNSQGFFNIEVVSDQAEPDGNFSSVAFPNPEEEHTLDKANELAKKHHIPWVFANDPDADRLQVAYKQDERITKLSGNAMGSIFGYFAIKRALENNLRPLVASSIVSSRMLRSIALAEGAQYVDSLTGFSNIVDKAIKAEKDGWRFIFGYEEAIGFLLGQTVLDKDGISAGLRFMEIAGYLSLKKTSVWQLLDELYLRYGLFESIQWSLRFSGVQAMSEMARMMSDLRNRFLEVKNLLDGAECQFYDLALKQEKNCYAGLTADVLIFETTNIRLLCRPSGTEPKVKFYLEMSDKPTDLLMLDNQKKQLVQKMNGIKNGFLALFCKKGPG